MSRHVYSLTACALSLLFLSQSNACSVMYPFSPRDDQGDAGGSGTCGNQLIEAPEQCDGLQLGGWTCEQLSYLGGSLGCGADCRFDTASCMGSGSCGNDVMDPAEECDGPDLGGMTCETLAWGTGQLTCTAGCMFDQGSCGPAPVTFYDEFGFNTITAGDQRTPQVELDLVVWVDESGIPAGSGASNVRYRRLRSDPLGPRFSDTFEDVVHGSNTGDEGAPQVANPAVFFIDDREELPGCTGLDIYVDMVDPGPPAVDVNFSGDVLSPPMCAGEQDQLAVSNRAHGPPSGVQNRFIAWRNSGPPTLIYVAALSTQILTNPTTHSDASQVNETIAQAASEPTVAVANKVGSFKVLVAWTQATAAGSSEIAFRVAHSSGAGMLDNFIIPQSTLSTFTAGDQSQAAATGLFDGVPPFARFLVVWRDESGQGADPEAGGIRGRVVDENGQPLGTEFQVNTTVAGDQSQPSVALLLTNDTDGMMAFVVWVDSSASGSDTEGTAIRGRLFNSDGLPLSVAGSTDDFVINRGTVGDQLNPTVSEGNGFFLTAIVIWEDWGGNGDDIEGAAIRGRYVCLAADAADCTGP